MPMLWKLQYATRESLADAGGFAAALRRHLQYTPAGLTSVLLQIEEEQSAYLLQTGCAGCATGAGASSGCYGSCVPGCRVDLLRRVLAAGYPRSELAPVKRGLFRRPYTRAVVAWPGPDAQPLDASVLQGWTHARLHLHWRRRRQARQAQPELQAGVVMEVGEGADDPRDRLRAIGWPGVAVSRTPGWLRHRLQRAPWWTERRWPHDPYLLTPVSAATHWLMTPPTRPSSTLNLDAAASYANAAMIVQHLHEIEGRVEMLDLDPAGWTARVAATTPTGGEPTSLWETLRMPGGPLVVRDAARGAVALDPAQARPNGVTPPLLHLGMRPDGSWRWRPISATHHLVLSGAVEGEVILGMIAAVIHARPDLRVGVLDLAEGGALALQLVNLPGRLVTQDGGDPYELLGAIGRLPDADQPVLVVLRADTAVSAEAAALLVLRAALYRSVSLLLVVPSVEAIPLPLRNRCPRITVRQRDAQWQAPEGAWEWTEPAVVRLPWRDARLAWSHVRGEPGRRASPLLPREGFWAVPFALQEALAPGSEAQAQPEDVVLPPVDAALPPGQGTASAALSAADPAPLARPPTRCRVYPAPLAAAPARAPVLPEPTSAVPARDAPGPRPPAPTASAVARAAAEWSTTSLLPVATHDTRLAPPASALSDGTLAAYTTYTPHEDSAGNLVIDQRLLLLTLQWAEQIDPENQGISITRFRSGVGLPSKAHSVDLRTALREHGLIRRELKKEGWFRLYTVEEAVRAGKLPPGPWYTPRPNDVSRAAAPAEDVEPGAPGTEQIEPGAPGTDEHAPAAPVSSIGVAQGPGDLHADSSLRKDEVVA